MSIKKMRENNSQEFFDDLKRVREIMFYAEKSRSYFKTTRKELFKNAEKQEIRYYITDKVFVVKRNIMVVF